MAEGLLGFLGTPGGQGLLSAVAGGLAGARRGTPLNNIGRGLLAGTAGYAQGLDREQQAQQLAMQQQDRAQMRDLRDLQMTQARTQMEREQAQQAWRQGLPDVMKQATEASYGTSDVGPTMTPANPDALKQYAMLPNSPFADEILKQTMFPKPQEAFTLGEGQVRYGPDGRIVAQGPAKPVNYNDLIIPDGSGGYKINDLVVGAKSAIAKAGKPEISVDARNINTQEGEQSKVYGKGLGEMRLEIQNAGYQAPRTITQVERMNELLQGVEGGALANAGLQISNFANSLGFKIDPKLGDKQAAESLAVEMALSMRKAGTGPMTDKDFENFAKAVPNLAKTAEGRAQISATLVAKAERDMQIAAMARDYAQKNGGVIDDRFLSEVSQFIANNPVSPKQQATSNDGWSVRRK